MRDYTDNTYREKGFIIMGMAAGQARLLSITARINHNELRAQQITNAKLRLSDSTQAASDEYIKALNDTQLQFISYDASGNKMTSALTGNSLSYYGELKNQYGLINAAGQIMVSELDGHNFETSDTLEEFLDKYGLLTPEGQGTTVQVKNPEYDAAWDAYYKEIEEWKSREPKQADYTKEVVDYDNALYQSFITASKNCYDAAMTGGFGCYLHVLSHLLDLTWNADHTDYDASTFPKTYKTTTDQDIIVDIYQITGSAINGANQTTNMIPVSEALNDTSDPDKTYYASGSIGADLKPDATDKEKLYSDYYYDEAGNLQKKLLKQKVIDMFYMVQNRTTLGFTDQELYDLLASFQQDMALANTKTVLDEEAYNEAYTEWANEEHNPPEVDMYIDQVVRQLTDNDKGQWYINLWHRMNGESDYKSGYMNDEDYTEDAGWVSDSKTNENYVILEDGLMNSPEWLEFALKNGVITIEQVQYSNPTEEGSGLSDVTWTSIEYSSITDISEKSVEVEQTKAEVKYNKALKEIEAKDKQYDIDLKNLDTEHSALQTEYDSIKSTIDKNVERSFKAFS